MDPRNERDVEVQIEHLLKVLAAQSRRIDELTGGDGELQQALDLLERIVSPRPNPSGQEPAGLLGARGSAQRPS